MNADEYQKLADVENRHWFYVGKRMIVRSWLERLHPLQKHHLLVDCGAGTGTFAAEISGLCRVEAVDDHQESLMLARVKLGVSQVKEGSCTNLPYANASIDVLTALDVIEHVQEDRKALNEFARVLKPSGIVIITVPALMALWSDWDVVLHHFRRYTKRALAELVPTADFEIVHLAYINVAVLPIVFVVRKWREVKRRLGIKGQGRSEDSTPPAWLNAFLRWLFVKPACQSMVSFPAGVGLLMVLRKLR